jgi:hypothetical protein
MTRGKIFFLGVCLISLLACKAKTDTNTAAMKPLPADFRDFYEKFHNDSLYQISHIAFPLKGLPINVDSAMIAQDTFHFSLNDWRMHHPVDFGQGEFVQIITPMADVLITERIIKSDNTFGIERRFAKLSNNEWSLIYYVAPNRFSINNR